MSEGGFFQIPPEVLAQIAAHEDHKHMHHQDRIHQVKQFLDSLNEEQLEALDLVLLHVIHSEGDVAHFMRGQIIQIAQTKFDRCQCGEKHSDPDAFKKPVEPNTATEHKGRPIEDVPVPEDLYKDWITTPSNEVVGVGSQRWKELLREYNLIETPAGEGDVRTFTCACGMIYQSLQDRMLRPKGIEGCSGCQQKSAWG